jgi:hypothetical protein
MWFRLLGDSCKDAVPGARVAVVARRVRDLVGTVGAA